MKKIYLFLILIILLFAGIGFYLGWLDKGPQKQESLTSKQSIIEEKEIMMDVNIPTRLELKHFKDGDMSVE